MNMPTQGWQPVAQRITIPAIVVLAFGTGGNANGHRFLYLAPIQQAGRAVAPPAATKQPASLKTQLASIRDALSLSMLDLARLFGVTRQSVYAWMRGELPSDENSAHILRIEQALAGQRSIDWAGQVRLGQRILAGGKSVVDKLADDDPPRAVFAELAQLLAKEQEQREFLVSRISALKHKNIGEADLI